MRRTGQKIQNMKTVMPRQNIRVRERQMRFPRQFPRHLSLSLPQHSGQIPLPLTPRRHQRHHRQPQNLLNTHHTPHPNNPKTK
ncbi:hypothetical protein AB0C52_36150, partial [Streptomyces sp. NPDC048717]|uniref:hypothetical protein n=1 Tax=Streptomyces sp. NPDC048717 TaxID=3154928 RepID=UPI00341FA5AE